MSLRLAVLAICAGWCIGAFFEAAVARAQETRLMGQVVAVVDGGTLRIRLDTGNVETVRLRGLTAPATATSTAPADCFGPQAAARLAVLAPAGSPVELEIESPERDEGGRLLAYVWREDAMLMVNEQLLAEGFAALPSAPPASTYDEQFAHAQATAQAHSLGLWAACSE
jgi:micrococcal nuclease